MDGKILIVGGYGNVGRAIAVELSGRFPGQVIVAGRNFHKAQALARASGTNIIPLQLDVSNIPEDYPLPDDIRLVVMCLDLPNADFVRYCFKRGIHYVDISASYETRRGGDSLDYRKSQRLVLHTRIQATFQLRDGKVKRNRQRRCNMTDMNYAPVCGTYCGHCELLGKQCPGCGLVDGKPFWTRLMQMEVCPIHDCCRNRKRMEHCGLCEAMPCTTFLELRDPNMSDEEFQRSLKTRQTTLEKRKEVGTAQWLREVATEKR